ncbi:MAG: PhnD/SsuA/transferrin family substrate-binding protein [Sedimenticola sp.]
MGKGFEAWQRSTLRGAILVLLCFVAPAASLAEKVIRFAPLPLEDEKIIHEQFRGLVDYLQEATGYTLEWVHLDDYADIIAEFRANRIDLAYLGPLPYVILKRDYPPAAPLGCFRDADGRANYTCSLITWEESTLTPEKASGIHIGLTQPYSTCGYLSVSQMLGEAGRRLDGDGNSFSYAGSHSNAALGVARGEYDMAGVKTAIANRYRHLYIKSIATSHRYPGFALVANQNTLNSNLVESLQRALLELDPANDETLKRKMSKWGRHIRNGAIPPQECDYGNVANALKGLPWPIPGSSR